MKTCIVLGSGSDIAKAITPMLEADGWKVYGWQRDEPLPEWDGNTLIHWDLCIIAIGRVDPVGWWWAVSEDRWHQCFNSNLLVPIKLLRRLWDHRNAGAYVCWFAGSNPQKIMDGYSAYNVSKMAVLKAVEQLDHESPDCTFFALGPGVTDTKIHEATRKAQWPNPRLERADKHGSFTPMEDIYSTLQWCLNQSKEVVGGRNICVSDAMSAENQAGLLVPQLTMYHNKFKLRRIE